MTEAYDEILDVALENVVKLCLIKCCMKLKVTVYINMQPIPVLIFLPEGPHKILQFFNIIRNFIESMPCKSLIMQYFLVIRLFAVSSKKIISKLILIKYYQPIQTNHSVFSIKTIERLKKKWNSTTILRSAAKYRHEICKIVLENNEFKV